MALRDDEPEATVAVMSTILLLNHISILSRSVSASQMSSRMRAMNISAPVDGMKALVAYRAGLGRVPKRRKLEIQSEVDVDEDTAPSQEDRDEGSPKEEEVPMTPEETECAKVRAVLNANIGACFVKLDDHKQAVEACTEALLDDPNYVKVLQRRAASNEKINSWSSLTTAQEDYGTLLKILPPSDPQRKEIERSQRLLKPRLEAAQKAETAEMLGKLKGLGNSILGNFGLSTDNFKFEPNGQGGYSMNFTR
ncbi:Tetratricopeptide repeat protein 1 [Mycena venus]|uniref:Tetratricopeptide repeat protein 1 n=1 Tax=Mycena venus TaxID=2733690 RepID=A0A8H6XG92_9AGAR|nr:Tetratricopeptide repeat protein 1 [Mycena venus]